MARCLCPLSLFLIDTTDLLLSFLPSDLTATAHGHSGSWLPSRGLQPLVVLPGRQTPPPSPSSH